jgi:flavodoxin I
MKALVIYASFFGNTEKIAQAIGKGLGDSDQVSVLEVAQVKPETLQGLTVLVVGAPTRAFRPTPTIVAFLKSLPKNALTGITVGAFDTRISTKDVNSKFLNVMVKMFGYAAEPIGELLKKKGGNLKIAAEGFFVKDTKGPLKEGALERAEKWGKQLT